MKKLVFLSIILVVFFTGKNVYAAESDYIYSYNTKQTEETPCQLSVNIEDYKYINENCYVILKSESGQLYELSLSKINDYYDYIYLAPGDYQITKVSTYNETNYEFVYSNNIMVEKGSVASLHINVKNVSGLETTHPIDTETIKEYPTNEETSASETVESETESLQSVPADSNKTDYENYTCWNKGSSSGEILLTADWNTELYLDVKITSGTEPGNMKFYYSVNNGGFSEEISVPLSGTVELEKFTLVFDGQFAQNDVYSFFVPDPLKEITYSNPTMGLSIHSEDDSVYVYDIMKENNYKILVKIKKEGSLGEVVFVYSMDAGKTYSEELLISEDGIYSLGDTGLYLRFSDKTYSAEDSVTVSIKSASQEKSSGGVLILIIIVVIVVIFAYLWLLKKKKSDSEYNIRRWFSR